MSTRADELIREDRLAVHRRTDRFFAALMIGQWVAAIVIAAIRSPLTWDGGASRIHPHMLSAVFLGGAITCLPVVLGTLRAGAPANAYVNAVAQMLWSALLIDLTGGRVETHFHVFGSLVFLSFYREWRVLLPASAVVVADHLIRGTFAPLSVYGISNPEWWRFLEHGFWVVFIDTFLIAACRRSDREMRRIANSRASTEDLSDQLRKRIQERNAELAVAQKQLVASERMSSVGTLAAGVAHEINNPLAFILGNVDFAVRELRSSTPDIPETLIALEEAKVGGTRVRDIVRDLKLFARPPAEKGGATAVEPLLERSISMAANEIRHRAKLIRNYASVPAAAGGESRLGQVFLNLLINAAQAIPEGKADANEIRVTTRVCGTNIEVEIADTGSGIPDDVRDRIFDPFFTTKPVGVGTGLGLSICHGIVQSLGGDISVTSEVGKGTQFVIRLPMAPAEVAASDSGEAENVCSIETRDILVIDDEPLLARSLRRVLEPHRVIAETSGRSALVRIAAGERFDLVICDVMMPEMTGPDVYAEIRRIAPDQADRVMFLTGGAFTSSAKSFLAQTSQPILEKPADPREIRRTLDSFGAIPRMTRRRPTMTSLSPSAALDRVAS